MLISLFHASHRRAMAMTLPTCVIIVPTRWMDKRKCVIMSFFSLRKVIPICTLPYVVTAHGHLIMFDLNSGHHPNSSRTSGKGFSSGENNFP